MGRLLVQGVSNKEIARALDIEVVTVKRHIGNILLKLGARNRTQAAIRLAHRMGQKADRRAHYNPGREERPMFSEAELADATKKYSLDGYLRRHALAIPKISLSELEAQCRAFEAWEPRDSMYRVSTFLVREWWNDPAKLVDALSVLLLVWNGAFYRYGEFDQQALEMCLRENEGLLNAFRSREISSFGEADEEDTGRLFLRLSEALKRVVDGVRSPVSTGKALHLLAPNFFPLWDQYIAPAYGCPYSGELAGVAYIAFMRKTRSLAVQLTAELAADEGPRKRWLLGKTLLKRIDEFNYMQYTAPAMKQKRTKTKAD